MTKEDKILLQSKIRNEGFDYCFTEYSDWKEIEDDKFQELLTAFKTARDNLDKYLLSAGIDSNE